MALISYLVASLHFVKKIRELSSLMDFIFYYEYNRFYNDGAFFNILKNFFFQNKLLDHMKYMLPAGVSLLTGDMKPW